MMLMKILCNGFVLTLNLAYVLAYAVPKARVDVLHPKGFSVSIPDTPGIQIFAFHGNLNSPMEGLEAGQFSTDILKHKNGRWTFINRKHEIKPGDTLYYWLYVQKDSLGYRRDDQKHEFTEADVYGSINATEESVIDTTESTDRPTKPHQQQPIRPAEKPTTVNENCNASSPSMRVFPQEIHHHHHHYLPNITPSAGCPVPPNTAFGNTNSGNAGGSFTTGSAESVQQLAAQMRQVMTALENMKLKIATLSDVVDELINANGNAKLLLTGAKLESTTNLFELVRHVVLDRLDLKDLKNDIYSATRTKDGVVFDVASGLDKRRILARARERFSEDDALRIQDYYDPDAKKDVVAEPSLDVRFGER